MKHAITLVAAAGLASALALPANAETQQRSDGLRTKAPAVEHTDVSSQRRYYRRYGYYGPRYRYYGPRYGYYRPYGYGYYGPYAYGGPGVSLGFYGGPRFGVWF